MNILDTNDILHVNGINWSDAPIPRKWHRCTPWSEYWNLDTSIERCACGAVRRNHGPWILRNAKRKAVAS